MDMNWHYVKDGRTCGPFTLDQVRQLTLSGLLSPSDMVRCDADGKWVSAGTVPGLFTLRALTKPAASQTLPIARMVASPDSVLDRCELRRSPFGRFLVWLAVLPLALYVLHLILLSDGIGVPPTLGWLVKAGGSLAWVALGVRAIVTGTIPDFGGRLLRRPILYRLAGFGLIFAGFNIATMNFKLKADRDDTAPAPAVAAYEKVSFDGGEEVLYRPGYRAVAERLSGVLKDVGEFNGQSSKTFAVDKVGGGWVVNIVMTDAARGNPAVQAFYKNSLGVRLAARTFSGEPVEFRLCDRDLTAHAAVSVPAAGVVEIQGKDAVYFLGPIGDEAKRVAAAVAFINSQLPQNEPIGQAFRTEVRVYPEKAVRELVANCLIHQDFSVTGAGPMVEIFAGRMEITNPGEPLVDTLRFLDSPPKSRNEGLAAMMRRMKICEEAGTGIDKAVEAVEEAHLPALNFTVPPGFTRVFMLGQRTFGELDSKQRINACYQHACLRFVQGRRMTNASLRERMGIDDASAAQASRLIRDAVQAGVIKLFDPEARRKNASHVPIWA